MQATARRRHHQQDDRPPLGPEDDPYQAYLIWREERDAAARAEAPEGDADEAAEPVADDPGTPRRSWLRRLASGGRAGSRGR
ncbi:hypothetical protein GCM10009819_08550 [Agromyces tropicus]|uniref:Uncharacterized protein n=1 Tax=Agromyces tropicus TaxID=555371 RepID=A0ABN2U343_9MICO